MQHFLLEINKYKYINVQTLQSQVQDSVEKHKTHEEPQGQANHESRDASGPGFSAPDPSTGPEVPPEEILPIPIWKPFEVKSIAECIANLRCEGNCILTACSQTQPKIQPKIQIGKTVSIL